MSEELKPCPFCGEVPDLPSGDGTQYEIECGACGGAMVSVQISTLMTHEERSSDPFTDYRYAEQFIQRAKTEAIELWNTRATPPAAQVQGEQPMECSCPKIGEQWDPVKHGKDCPVHEPGVAQLQGELGDFEAWVRQRCGMPRHVPVNWEAPFTLDTWAAWNARAALSAPPAADMADAYVGSREDVAIWKRRALEAEQKVRVLDQRIDQLVLDAQGETRMGEPYIAPPAAGVPETVHVLRKAYEGNSAGLFNSGAPKHLWSAAMLELFESLDEEVQEEARETVMAHSDMRAVAAIDSVIALLAATTPPASEQQQAVVMPVAILIDTLERTRETIDGQLEIIAARAHGSHLDKAPVVRSLRVHRARCDEALTEYNRELLRLNPHLQPAAPADWCKTMDRPKSQCGCPDCGSSLVQVDGYPELPSQGGDA